MMVEAAGNTPPPLIWAVVMIGGGGGNRTRVRECFHGSSTCVARRKGLVPWCHSGRGVHGTSSHLFSPAFPGASQPASRQKTSPGITPDGAGEADGKPLVRLPVPSCRWHLWFAACLTRADGTSARFSRFIQTRRIHSPPKRSSLINITPLRARVKRAFVLLY